MNNDNDVQTIINYIQNEAAKNNLKINDNCEKIAKIKLKFFGVDNWRKCPCYGSDDQIHGCGTTACLDEINKNGICHCKLFSDKSKS